MNDDRVFQALLELKQAVGSLGAKVDDSRGFTKAVSEKVDKLSNAVNVRIDHIENSLDVHVSDIGAHGIEVRDQDKGNTIAWLGLGMSLVLALVEVARSWH